MKTTYQFGNFLGNPLPKLLYFLASFFLFKIIFVLFHIQNRYINVYKILSLIEEPKIEHDENNETFPEHDNSIKLEPANDNYSEFESLFTNFNKKYPEKRKMLKRLKNLYNRQKRAEIENDVDLVENLNQQISVQKEKIIKKDNQVVTGPGNGSKKAPGNGSIESEEDSSGEEDSGDDSFINDSDPESIATPPESEAECEVILCSDGEKTFDLGEYELRKRLSKQEKNARKIEKKSGLKGCIYHR